MKIKQRLMEKKIAQINLMKKTNAKYSINEKLEKTMTVTPQS